VDVPPKEKQMGEIIVGVDGSEGSRAALRWAATIAAATGAGLRAVGAWQYPASAATPAGPAELPGPETMDERTCDDLRSIVREELRDGADHVTVEAGRGPAAPALLGVATSSNADMLVVGARGLGGFGGLLLGSVSQEIVEHSACPVVVLRDGHDPSTGPIVIGLDGSEGARRALEWALDLAGATGSDIIAVHAPGTGANNATVEAARLDLQQWCTPIERRGIAYETRVDAGDARSVIVQTADDAGASLLVVGTRGLGAVQGLLLGSVAGYIARYAHRPIAVVPPLESGS
jgi:nucleotide-binding universal stress UspA family protein